jgi:Photosynthetic reaction centre cytochrome C subunit
MLTRTVAAFALFLAASSASGCKPDRSKPLPMPDAGADTSAQPADGAGGARAPIASGGGEKPATAGAADAGTDGQPAAEPQQPKAEPGSQPEAEPGSQPATGGGGDAKTGDGDGGKGGGKDRAVKKPRNVKALPGSWSTRQVTDYMKKQVARGLGAECDHCHDTSDFAADNNKHKQSARAMMQMNAQLNRLYFSGKQVITCFTCHQGKPRPARKK